jgi:hypothetical protein
VELIGDLESAWELVLDEAEVVVVRTGGRLEVGLVDGAGDELDLVLEGPLRTRVHAGEATVDVDPAGGSAALARLAGTLGRQRLVRCRAGRDGTLDLVFGWGTTVAVAPHPDCPAWEVVFTARSEDAFSFAVLCTPGGGRGVRDATG